MYPLQHSQGGSVKGRFDGLNRHADPHTCMVVGCRGKALYRNVLTRGERGYCATHKAMAISHAPASQHSTEKHMAKWTQTHENDWVIEVNDRGMPFDL